MIPFYLNSLIASFPNLVSTEPFLGQLNLAQLDLAHFGLLAMTPRIFYAIPLIVVVSLVYGATRHENLREIIDHSVKTMLWIVAFMAVILAMIWLVGFWN